jgi:hypothetical protein
MKYFITESRLHDTVIKFLNNNYGGLEPFVSKKHPGHIFFIKDGEIIIEFTRVNGLALVSYEKVWDFLLNFFGFNFEEGQEIIKKWIIENYDLPVKHVTQYKWNIDL